MIKIHPPCLVVLNDSPLAPCRAHRPFAAPLPARAESLLHLVFIELPSKTGVFSVPSQCKCMLAVSRPSRRRASESRIVRWGDVRVGDPAHCGIRVPNIHRYPASVLVLCHGGRGVMCYCAAPRCAALQDSVARRALTEAEERAWIAPNNSNKQKASVVWCGGQFFSPFNLKRPSLLL